ncbi:zinc dependent phospholipase C family protein [Clostridium bowmanii]|uniref:zinc dependent phospholipase C family protein n=1 Tax=Clostridium bowmanii TaxID=132925 RepID=UPI001C0B928A|nr:zinc dependent phospholipase C family protein [Clostridium bowmanii]MBU3189508.1 zinc dependent phospholipase C family protein [Clostridium bowmanii]MCA1074123.1 zinc dependent phospholipase C family protein [Clostridium bowmanii]
MIVDTHLLISQILYKHISKGTNFKLNRLAFAYGNIKPDFTNKDIKSAHTLEESLHNVTKYSEELMGKNISNKEFSISLGVTCHFICDYFCLYHREGNEKKAAYEHFFYELILHVKLIILLLKGKINLSNHELFENNVEKLVLALQKKYNSETKSLTRDINNALIAASQISNLIVCSSQLLIQQNETNISKAYLLSHKNS